MYQYVHLFLILLVRSPFIFTLPSLEQYLLTPLLAYWPYQWTEPAAGGLYRSTVPVCCVVLDFIVFIMRCQQRWWMMSFPTPVQRVGKQDQKEISRQRKCGWSGCDTSNGEVPQPRYYCQDQTDQLTSLIARPSLATSPCCENMYNTFSIIYESAGRMRVIYCKSRGNLWVGYFAYHYD